jgi:hypothetical protein
MCSDPHIAPLTAAMLGKWHRAHVSGDMAPMLWETIDKWLSVGMAGWISRGTVLHSGRGGGVCPPPGLMTNGLDCIMP